MSQHQAESQSIREYFKQLIKQQNYEQMVSISHNNDSRAVRDNEKSSLSPQRSSSRLKNGQYDWYPIIMTYGQTMKQYLPNQTHGASAEEASQLNIKIHSSRNHHLNSQATNLSQAPKSDPYYQKDTVISDQQTIIKRLHTDQRKLIQTLSNDYSKAITTDRKALSNDQKRTYNSKNYSQNNHSSSERTNNRSPQLTTLLNQNNSAMLLQAHRKLNKTNRLHTSTGSPQSNRSQNQNVSHQAQSQKHKTNEQHSYQSNYQSKRQNSLIPQYAVATHQYQNHQYRQAITTLLPYQPLVQSSYLLALNMALLHTRLNQWNKAQHYVERALHNKSGDYEAVCQYVRVRRGQGDMGGVIDFLRKKIDSNTGAHILKQEQQGANSTKQHGGYGSKIFSLNTSQHSDSAQSFLINQLHASIIHGKNQSSSRGDTHSPPYLQTATTLSARRSYSQLISLYIEFATDAKVSPSAIASTVNNRKVNLSTYYNMALMMKKVGHYREAIPHFETIINLLRSNLYNHSDQESSQNSTLTNNSPIKQSLSLKEQNLRFLQLSLTNIADCYMKILDGPRAIQWFSALMETNLSEQDRQTLQNKINQAHQLKQTSHSPSKETDLNSNNLYRSNMRCTQSSFSKRMLRNGQAFSETEERAVHSLDRNNEQTKIEDQSDKKLQFLLLKEKQLNNFFRRLAVTKSPQNNDPKLIVLTNCWASKQHKVIENAKKELFGQNLNYYEREFEQKREVLNKQLEGKQLDELLRRLAELKGDKPSILKALTDTEKAAFRKNSNNLKSFTQNSYLNLLNNKNLSDSKSKTTRGFKSAERIKPTTAAPSSSNGRPIAVKSDRRQNSSVGKYWQHPSNGKGTTQRQNDKQAIGFTRKPHDRNHQGGGSSKKILNTAGAGRNVEKSPQSKESERNKQPQSHHWEHKNQQPNVQPTIKQQFGLVTSKEVQLKHQNSLPTIRPIMNIGNSSAVTTVLRTLAANNNRKSKSMESQETLVNIKVEQISGQSNNDALIRTDSSNFFLTGGFGSTGSNYLKNDDSQSNLSHIDSPVSTSTLATTFNDMMKDCTQLQLKGDFKSCFEKLTSMYKQFKTDQQKQAILFKIAKLFEKQKQYVKAEKTYMKFSQYDKATALYSIGCLKLEQNDIQKGVQYLQKANCVKKHDKQIEQQLLYAYSLRDSTIEKALLLASNMLKRQPQSLEALMMTARILQKMGRIRQAIQIMLEMNKHMTTEVVRHFTGLLYLQDGNVTQAFSYFSQAIESNPVYIPSLIQIATILSEIRPNESIVLLERVLELNSTNQLAIARLGKIYESVHQDYQRAIDVYRKGIVQGGSYQAYMKIGDCLFKQDCNLDALCNYRQALALSKTPEIYVKIAQVHQRRKQWKRSQQSYQLALQVLNSQPNSQNRQADRLNYLSELGRISLQLGEYVAVIAAFEEICEQEETSERRQLLGQAYFGKGDYDLAIESFERAHKLEEPNENLALLEQIAICYDRKEKYLASKVIYQKIIAADGNNFRAINNLANILLIMGQTSQAFYWLEAMLQKCPNDWQRRLKVADIYGVVGDWSKVQQHLLRAHKQNQNSIPVLERMLNLYKEKRQIKQISKIQKKIFVLKAHLSKN